MVALILPNYTCSRKLAIDKSSEKTIGQEKNEEEVNLHVILRKF